MSHSSCGKHTEVAATENLRLSKCSCGTYHMNLYKHGLTVRLSATEFQELASAIAVGRDAPVRIRILPPAAIN